MTVPGMKYAVYGSARSSAAGRRRELAAVKAMPGIGDAFILRGDASVAGPRGRSTSSSTASRSSPTIGGSPTGARAARSRMGRRRVAHATRRGLRRGGSATRPAAPATIVGEDGDVDAAFLARRSARGRIRLSVSRPCGDGADELHRARTRRQARDLGADAEPGSSRTVIARTLGLGPQESRSI